MKSLRKNKYNAVKTEVDGILFDSKAEAARYLELKDLLSKQEILSFERQPEFELIPSFTKNGKKIRAIKYRADFIVYHNNGTVIVEDVKGMITDIFKIKRKMFDYTYPELTLVVVQ
jgi:hypothetical protein